MTPAPCPAGDGQVDFEEFVTLLGPKLSTSGIPEKFHGTDFDTVFWKVGGDPTPTRTPGTPGRGWVGVRVRIGSGLRLGLGSR